MTFKDLRKKIITIESPNQYLKWQTKNLNTDIATEQKFKIELSGIPFNGSIDRIERTPTGDYDVIDFKTGSVYETKKSIKDNIQMNIYALTTEKLYEKLPRTTSLFYLKKDKTITNKVKSVYVYNVRKTLEEKVNSILREDFKASPRYDICRKCDYQVICDFKKVR